MKLVVRILGVLAAIAIILVGVAFFGFNWGYNALDNHLNYDLAPALLGLAIVDIGVVVAYLALPWPFMRGGKKFWAALLATLIPIVVVGIASMIVWENTVVGTAGGLRTQTHVVMPFFYAAFGWFLSALAVGVVFFTNDHREIPQGIWMANGLAIAFLVAALPHV